MAREACETTALLALVEREAAAARQFGDITRCLFGAGDNVRRVGVRSLVFCEFVFVEEFDQAVGFDGDIKVEIDITDLAAVEHRRGRDVAVPEGEGASGPGQAEDVVPTVTPEVHTAIVGRAELAPARINRGTGAVLGDEQRPVIRDNPEWLNPVSSSIVLGGSEENTRAGDRSWAARDFHCWIIQKECALNRPLT